MTAVAAGSVCPWCDGRGWFVGECHPREACACPLGEPQAPLHPTRCTGCKSPLECFKCCTEQFGVLCSGCASNLVGKRHSWR